MHPTSPSPPVTVNLNGLRRGVQFLNGQADKLYAILKGIAALTREFLNHTKQLAALDKRVELGIAALASDITDLESAIDALGTDAMVFHEDRFANDRTLIEELRHIRSRLDNLDDSAGNHTGYAKEIDHALERIAAIEKHLGLPKRFTH